MPIDDVVIAVELLHTVYVYPVAVDAYDDVKLSDPSIIVKWFALNNFTRNIEFH